MPHNRRVADPALKLTGVNVDVGSAYPCVLRRYHNLTDAALRLLDFLDFDFLPADENCRFHLPSVRCPQRFSVQGEETLRVAPHYLFVFLPGQSRRLDEADGIGR